jgi:oxygen-independent coproporphyrinogen-3 oxidase
MDSVYFGGGTPSYFGAKRLCAVFEALKNTGRVLKEAEVTVEVNPDSAKLPDLKLLRREGFNRVSLGVQSANNDILKLIGRRHNWKQVETAVKNAREAGFDNVSLDLIYGLPSQTKSDWSDTLAKALELKPEHISCYGLTLEPGTPMYQYKGSPFLPNDDEQADMYLYAVELLQHYGYAQYEISNFSIGGYESRHNLKYWRLEDYMGFGAGAHSCVGGLRYSFVKSTERYITGILGHTDIVDEYEPIDALERASEFIMLSMRTVRGLSADEYHRLYRSDFAPIEKLLNEFVTNGWAVREADSWHFTSSGFLLSNVLIGALLEAQSGNRVAVNPWMRAAFDSEDKTELPPGEDEAFRASIKKRIISQ